MEFSYEFKSSKDSEHPEPIHITNKEAAVLKAKNNKEVLKALNDLQNTPNGWFLDDGFGYANDDFVDRDKE